MSEPDWKDFYIATAEIAKRLDVSKADAQASLRRACADQHIRSMKAPLDPDDPLPIEFWTRVAPNDWHERQVDYDGPDADGCKVLVMLNVDDFERWRDSLPQPSADSRRDAVIRKLLEDGKRPPHNIQWKPFCDKTRNGAGGWISKGQPAHGFSDRQIKRVVKERLEQIRPKTITLQRVDKRVS